MGSGTGMWRWWAWQNIEPQPWHLRVGNDFRTLCDQIVNKGARSLTLAAGPPAIRCGKCLDVAAHRLGLKVARDRAGEPNG